MEGEQEELPLKKKKTSKEKISKEKKDTFESGNKVWVFVVLVVTVLISLFFIYKGGGFVKKNTPPTESVYPYEVNPTPSTNEPGWFGSSTYEFTN